MNKKNQKNRKRQERIYDIVKFTVAIIAVCMAWKHISLCAVLSLVTIPYAHQISENYFERDENEC